jgi:hypothetical protein
MDDCAHTYQNRLLFEGDKKERGKLRKGVYYFTNKIQSTSLAFYAPSYIQKQHEELQDMLNVPNQIKQQNIWNLPKPKPPPKIDPKQTKKKESYRIILERRRSEK